MLKLILVLALGFGGGYGTREWISRRRRAIAREEFFQRKAERQQIDPA
jgi:hypothetical protein